MTPAAPVAARLSLDEQKLKERIVKDHTERLAGNHYKVLGLQQTATPADIKKAYVTLAREWHPDSLSGTPFAHDESVKSKLAALFGRLQDANAILSHPDERAAYDRSGAAVVTTSGGKKIRRTAEANVAFIKAETYFKKKDWRLAEVHYRLASDLDEEDPKFRIHLAWAFFHNETKDRIVRTAEAKKLLAEILKAHRIADAAYKLGLIERHDGNEPEAMKRFDEAYKLDPKNPDIQRERRLKDMRADKEKADNESLLGRFKKLTR
jgi:curved DNA-binding protein CbpA